MNADEFLKRLIDEGKVCPMPTKWKMLWEMLPDRKRVGSGWEPALPLILAAWWATTDEQKMERFQAHVLYAEEKGLLNKIVDFLNSLPEEDWYYGN